MHQVIKDQNDKIESLQSKVLEGESKISLLEKNVQAVERELDACLQSQRRETILLRGDSIANLIEEHPRIEVKHISDFVSSKLNGNIKETEITEVAKMGRSGNSLLVTLDRIAIKKHIFGLVKKYNEVPGRRLSLHASDFLTRNRSIIAYNLRKLIRENTNVNDCTTFVRDGIPYFKKGTNRAIPVLCMSEFEQTKKDFFDSVI